MNESEARKKLEGFAGADTKSTGGKEKEIDQADAAKPPKILSADDLGKEVDKRLAAKEEAEKKAKDEADKK